MIVVTGATGLLGHQIVMSLLERVDPSGLAISVRDPDKATDFANRGIRVRHGDFAQPSSLASTFEGADQVLIVSSNAAAHGGDPLTQHRSAIEAAKQAGAKRIVYTSHMGASAASAFPPMHTHAATEDMLRGSGVSWTALRHGFYASTVPMMIGDAVETGVLAAPEDGKVSWTAHSDLAAGAAAILVEEGRFSGPTPPLTATTAEDLDDIAEILSDLSGRAIVRQLITDAQLAAEMTRRGAPQSTVDITLAMYRAASAGEFSATDPTLASLLGRAPKSVRHVLQDCSSRV